MNDTQWTGRSQFCHSAIHCQIYFRGSNCSNSYSRIEKFELFMRDTRAAALPLNNTWKKVGWWFAIYSQCEEEVEAALTFLGHTNSGCNSTQQNPIQYKESPSIPVSLLNGIVTIPWIKVLYTVIFWLILLQLFSLLHPYFWVIPFHYQVRNLQDSANTVNFFLIVEIMITPLRFLHCLLTIRN